MKWSHWIRSSIRFWTRKVSADDGVSLAFAAAAPPNFYSNFSPSIFGHQLLLAPPLFDSINHVTHQPPCRWSMKTFSFIRIAFNGILNFIFFFFSVKWKAPSKTGKRKRSDSFVSALTGRSDWFFLSLGVRSFCYHLAAVCQIHGIHLLLLRLQLPTATLSTRLNSSTLKSSLLSRHLT